MADILTQLQTCLDQVGTLLAPSPPQPSSPIPNPNSQQLATQFYATLGYLTTYHDNSPATPPSTVPSAAPALAKIPKNSSAPPAPAGAPGAEASPPPQGPSGSAAPETPGGRAAGAGAAGAAAAAGGGGGEDAILAPAPDSPRTFASRQRELARDLVIKEQQIEYLISVLPGIGSSEKEQEGRIRELEGELRGVEGERERKVRELRVLRRKLEGVLGGVEMGIYGDRGSS